MSLSNCDKPSTKLGLTLKPIQEGCTPSRAKLSLGLKPIESCGSKTTIINYITVVEGAKIEQTAVVTPIEGEDFYIFTELIGIPVANIMKVFRGTGTVLRAQTSTADNEHAQYDSVTGKITVSFVFGANETLWIEYKALS